MVLVLNWLEQLRALSAAEVIGRRREVGCRAKSVMAWGRWGK